MITDTSNTQELFSALDEAVSELLGFVSALDETELNQIPYEKSWTAGQLVRHVTKSASAMTNAMRKESKPAERNPGEKIAGLRKVFLDFANKMQSPDFIVPEEKQYQKEETLNELTDSFEAFKKAVGQANLNELVAGLPLGEVTKLELLHFVLYHTQRHLNQLKRIYEALEKN